MNVGQILETHLGWSCTELGEKIKKLVKIIKKKLKKLKKFQKFLKSVYGKEIYDKILKNLINV